MSNPTKPMTPITKTYLAKERRHRHYEKKRAAEIEQGRFLKLPSTYYRVLRSGNRYKTFGGARAR